MQIYGPTDHRHTQGNEARLKTSEMCGMGILPTA